MGDRAAPLLPSGKAQSDRFFYLGSISDPHHGKLTKAGYNPAEPRDNRGRWTRDEDDGAGTVSSAAYRGHFHDLVVDDFLNGLRSEGSTVLKNVRVLGINGILAIPDGASKPTGNDQPYFIEVKTGEDPKFTENQKQVYPLICAGGHATSFDTRVAQLGLVPGAPFPPMRILLVMTGGPGQPFGYIDYCKSIGMEVN